MTLQGSFNDILGRQVDVTISTSGGPYVTIGDESYEGAADGVFFAAEGAVEISCEADDTLEPLVRHSCTIRLLTHEPLLGLFVNDALTTAVEVSRQGEVLFAGFIEPRTYSQPFNDWLDEIEVNCVDWLSALQYTRYRGLDTEDKFKAYSAGKSVTMQALLDDAFDSLGVGYSIAYDGSRQTADGADVFGGLCVNDAVICGDDFSDVWTRQEVVEHTLRFLGLRAVQDGKVVRISDRRRGYSGYGSVTVSDENAGSDNTTISIGETYNRVKVQARLDQIEEIIESPTDPTAGLVSNEWPALLNRPPRLCRTYLAVREYDGDREDKIEDVSGAVAKMIGKDLGLRGYDAVTDDYAYKTDWYYRIRSHQLWTFPFNSAGDSIEKFWHAYKGDGDDTDMNEHLVPWYASGDSSDKLYAYLVGLAKAVNTDEADIVTSSLSFTNTLVVNVGGHFTDAPDSDKLLDSAPVAVFNGNAEADLTPPDAATVNYIVISGRLRMIPALRTTPYHDIVNRLNRNGGSAPAGWWTDEEETGAKLAMCAATKYYRIGYHDSEYTEDQFVQANSASWPTRGFVPPFEGDIHMFKYTRNSDGSTYDKKWKLPVLACMLRVGDKVCVETGDGDVGKADNFEWRTFKDRSRCSSDEEYYGQCIYIGYNPAIGSYILGPEHEVMNNVTHDMGIDTTGTAIPITASQAVNGQIHFEILGPVDLLYENNVYKHATWFRSSKTTTDYKRVLPHTAAIHLTDFKIRVVSSSDPSDTDSGSGSGDLVYISDEAPGFSNELELPELPFNSQVTTAEAEQMGISLPMSRSTVTRNGENITAITDSLRSVTDRAERLLVDSVYSEFHRPRVVMEQTLFDTDGNGSLSSLFYHPAMPGVAMRAIGRDRDVQEATVTMHLKEIDE